MCLAFFLMGCHPDPEFKLVKADRVEPVLVTSPTWKEIKYDDTTYLGLDKFQFQMFMSDLNKIADRMERLDLVIKYYEDQADEANK